MWLLPELIYTDQVGGSADDIEVDHTNSIDPCEGDKSKMSLVLGNDNETLICNQKVGETQSRAVENNVNHIGVDVVDVGSSLTN